MSAELYERMWATADYRKVAPGESLAWRFVELAKPDSRVIDFGCGTGRGAALIHVLANVPVTAIDFAMNARDVEVCRIKGIEFRQHDLREPVGQFAEYGYCTDVMEHIAPDDVERVLLNVVSAARRVFFSISTVPDHFGPALAGEPLHLTVQPHAWWREKLVEGLQCKVLWEQETEHAAMFYVTGFASAKDIAEKSALNATEDRLRENIRKNLALGLQEIAPHQVQPDTHLMLLAGGPSLADHEAEIVEFGRSGGLCVTVNGSYEWLLARGIKPAAHIALDARPFNQRFVRNIVDSCRYLVSSQCAHEVVAALPADRTWLWHSSGDEMLRELFHAHYGEATKEWFPVWGGSTVVSRGLVLLAMLGFRNIEVFGWDSCLRGDEHHAYSQPENDSKVVFDVRLGERTFRCHSWMVVQAQEVPDIIKSILGQIEGFNLPVRGDGLIAAMLEHAAQSGKGD